jgi:hypothetical protein
MSPFSFKVWTAAALASLAAVNLSAANTSFKGYNFEAHVVRANSQNYREFYDTGSVKLKVRPGDEYAVVIRNPLPVQAAVALSVDGLNSIDGKRTTAKDARKWIIAPYGTVTINGWQTSLDNARKFVFTKPDASYADWKEKKDHKSYTQNLGVIGVAWFWNAADLDRALHPPQPFNDYVLQLNGLTSNKASAAPGAPAAAAAEASKRAGTGMGDAESHPVTEVNYDADAGMYSVRDVLKIFYEFADEPVEPSPFANDHEDDRFTPEMEKS